MELFEKTVEKNYVYEGKIIKVRRDKAELPNGKPCTREVVEHNGGVCVAALTDNDELMFVYSSGGLGHGGRSSSHLR